MKHSKVIRFYSPDPITFSWDETPFVPEIGKDYVFALQDQGEGKFCLIDLDSSSPSGHDISLPINFSSFTIVGSQVSSKKTSYDAGFSAPMGDDTRLFLTYMAEDSHRHPCSLGDAYRILFDMGKAEFEDEIGFEDSGKKVDWENIRDEIGRDLFRLSQEWGEPSLVGKIVGF